MTSDELNAVAHELLDPAGGEAQLRAQLAAIDQVREQVRFVRRAQLELEAAVKSARDAGASWARIGVATGLTSEGARRRWLHSMVDDVSDLL